MNFKEFCEIAKSYATQDSVKNTALKVAKYFSLILLGYLVGKKVGAFKQREKEFDRKIYDTTQSFDDLMNLGSKQREMEMYGFDE